MRRQRLRAPAGAPPAALGLTLLLLAGCIRGPHLGKDEGRAAIVWEHEGLGGAPAPTPAVSADEAAERRLRAELLQAQAPDGDELAAAAALYDLAILHRGRGEHAEADRLYRQALEIRERVQGPHHPDVAVVLNNLAALHAAQGDHATAQPMLDRALRIRESAFGDRDVRTAQSLNNLALLLAAAGDATAAEPLYRRALAVLETGDAPTEGDRACDLERVLENYAALLADTGRDAEADAMEARARSAKNACAADSPD